MARQPKDPKPVTIYTSLEVCRHLDELAATGFFGSSRSSVAKHLLTEKLLEVLGQARSAGVLTGSPSGGKPESGSQSQELAHE